MPTRVAIFHRISGKQERARCDPGRTSRPRGNL